MNGLLDYLVEQRLCLGGVPDTDVSAFERLVRMQLPESYRQFLRRCGALARGALEINGLGVPADDPRSVPVALQALRRTYPSAPPGLVPLRLAGPASLHCLDCSRPSPDKADAPVVLFDLQVGSPAVRPLSSGFAPYLQKLVVEWYHRDVGLRTMDAHVRRFDAEYLHPGKLPRNHIWRPYRFCVQDVVLGLVVVRHSLPNNCLDVDVCVVSDVPEYEPGSGARMTATFLLSEAYKCGGTMEIRFSANVEGGTVPESIGRLARGLGVELRHSQEGRIGANEARQFFMALTGFSPRLHERIMALRAAGKLSPERVCYAVQHGIWTRGEVEALVFGSPWPEAIFAGEVAAEQQLLYRQAMLHTRAAIMGGLLDRILAKRSRNTGDTALDLEDDTRRLEIGFDPAYYAKIYLCAEELPLLWLDKAAARLPITKEGQPLVVLLRSRDAVTIATHFAQDLAVAGQLAAGTSWASAPRVCIAVPRDFEDLPEAELARCRAQARKQDIDILICPETTTSLDMEASQRLARSRIIRQ